MNEPNCWMYLRSESQLWTVGFHRPDGRWEPESDPGSPDEAARRGHYLNGGCDHSTREL